MSQTCSASFRACPRAQPGSPRSATASSSGASRWPTTSPVGSTDAVNRATKLSDGGVPYDWIYLAMANQQLGRHDEALRWYQKTTDWIGQHQNRNFELGRFCGEARSLLGIKGGGGG